MARETLRIDGCRGDDDLQIRSLRQQLFKVTQQKIDVEAALVCLIDDDSVVLHQQAVLLDLGQQNTIGHQLDHRVLADMIAEAHLITDSAAWLAFQLLGNTIRHRSRRQTSRLGMANQALNAAPQLHTDFW